MCVQLLNKSSKKCMLDGTTLAAAKPQQLGSIAARQCSGRGACNSTVWLADCPPPLSSRDDIRPGIIESSWRSALTLMLFDSFMVTSHGARVAVLAFMFLVS